MHKKTIIKTSIGVAILALLLIIWKPWNLFSDSYATTLVQKGAFETSILVSGELKAQKALDIKVPEVSFNDEVDIWAMKILSLVEEGKIVEKGEEIAQLEPTEVEENLSTVNTKLNEHYTRLEDAKIDSSLTIATARETIQKEKDRVIDAELKVEQSSFESKAVQRQAGIELEKAQRAFAKAERDLITQTQKHKTKIARSQRKVNKFEYKKKLLEQLRSELNVKSPASGMIIYGTAYNGQKVKVGSRVGRWMPLIATLPDLSTLISEMQVKEIDIAKVKVGQPVHIKIDAFPKNDFKGHIISIANIGQALPGEFQNGFKVKVQLSDFKEALLPGMTSSNTIVTSFQKDCLFVAKQAVFGNDSLKYVVKKSGFKLIRQEIEIGQENETHFEVTKGLAPNKKVLIELPEKYTNLELVRL